MGFGSLNDDHLLQGLARGKLRDAQVRGAAPVPRDVALRSQQDGGEEPRHRLRPHPRPHGRGQHARHGHGHEPAGTLIFVLQDLHLPEKELM